jgi:phage pi2 protein 07
MPRQNIVLNYANIKVPVTSPAARITKNKIHTIRLKDEIKYLYRKKEKLNKELYYAHQKAAQEWGNSWNFILDSVYESINNEMEKKYKKTSTKN